MPIHYGGASPILQKSYCGKPGYRCKVAFAIRAADGDGV